MKNDFMIKDNVLIKYTGSDETVIVPAEITGIGEQAFAGTKVKSVTFSGDIRKIGCRAFSPCPTLEYVTANGKVDEIDRLAFYNCENLLGFNISRSPGKIGKKAFYGCSVFRPEKGGLIVSPGKIGDCAFSFTGTEYVTIESNNVCFDDNYERQTDWGAGCFSYCKNLRRVQVAKSAKAVSERMFERCTALEDITIIADDIVVIMPGAFKDCTGLRSISFPRKCTVGAESFAGCTGLTYAGFAGGERYVIGTGAFRGCTKLEQIELPRSVDHIPRSAFSGCIALKRAEVNSDIFEAAFRDCISLECVHIGSNVKLIGREAFFGCRSLTKINIPESVRKIDDHAFAECDRLSLSVDPKILTPGSDIFGSTYGLDDADEITDEEVESYINNTTA